MLKVDNIVPLWTYVIPNTRLFCSAFDLMETEQLLGDQYNLGGGLIFRV